MVRGISQPAPAPAGDGTDRSMRASISVVMTKGYINVKMAAEAVDDDHTACHLCVCRICGCRSIKPISSSRRVSPKPVDNALAHAQTTAANRYTDRHSCGCGLPAGAVRHDFDGHGRGIAHAGTITNARPDQNPHTTAFEAVKRERPRDVRSVWREWADSGSLLIRRRSSWCACWNCLGWTRPCATNIHRAVRANPRNPRLFPDTLSANAGKFRL